MASGIGVKSKPPSHSPPLSSFSLPPLPSAMKGRPFPFLLQLSFLNGSLTFLAAAISYLAHWSVGWFFLLFMFSSAGILILLNRSMERLLAEVESDRDCYHDGLTSLEDKITQITSEAIAVDYDYSSDPETGKEIVIEVVMCRNCKSKHSLLVTHPFHPSLHNRGCQIPILRSQVEQIDLSLPLED